ncbi:unnamed protein product [Microthlaspi erraticum]|uniref:Pectate lyase superfamily protein domain-containing protein n=1 Tax=Microthlaspi erraticum TaxID=1685480 RepID=A0A6D2IC60_9BRAS|nr:unnamed protein product [Microthlaspi erraticum]
MVSRFWILCASSLIFFLAVSSAPTVQGQLFDVRNYGAGVDGRRNNALAFAKAWMEACQWSGGRSTVYVPPGIFDLPQVMFTGPCKNPVTFLIEGTLLAPRSPDAIKGDAWIIFKDVDYLTVTGGGLLDGQGSYSWPHNDCDKNSSCRPLAINMGFMVVKHSKINVLHSLNSKMGHFKFYAVEDFNVTGVTVTAPGDI